MPTKPIKDKNNEMIIQGLTSLNKSINSRQKKKYNEKKNIEKNIKKKKQEEEDRVIEESMPQFNFIDIDNI
jgi:hypothetical protein